MKDAACGHNILIRPQSLGIEKKDDELATEKKRKAIKKREEHEGGGRQPEVRRSLSQRPQGVTGMGLKKIPGLKERWKGLRPAEDKVMQCRWLYRGAGGSCCRWLYLWLYTADPD